MRSSPSPRPRAEVLSSPVLRALVLPLVLPLMWAGLLLVGALLLAATWLGQGFAVICRAHSLVAAVLPWTTTRVVLLSCISLWVLSACGTAPLPVGSCPPVPAELLTPPTQPVPLTPASPSTTPGTTTPSTPPAAPPTGRALRA